MTERLHSELVLRGEILRRAIGQLAAARESVRSLGRGLHLPGHAEDLRTIEEDLDAIMEDLREMGREARREAPEGEP